MIRNLLVMLIGCASFAVYGANSIQLFMGDPFDLWGERFRKDYKLGLLGERSEYKFAPAKIILNNKEVFKVKIKPSGFWIRYKNYDTPHWRDLQTPSLEVRLSKKTESKGLLGYSRFQLFPVATKRNMAILLYLVGVSGLPAREAKIIKLSLNGSVYRDYYILPELNEDALGLMGYHEAPIIRRQDSRGQGRINILSGKLNVFHKPYDFEDQPLRITGESIALANQFPLQEYWHGLKSKSSFALSAFDPSSFAKLLVVSNLIRGASHATYPENLRFLWVPSMLAFVPIIDDPSGTNQGLIVTRPDDPLRISSPLNRMIGCANFRRFVNMELNTASHMFKRWQTDGPPPDFIKLIEDLHQVDNSRELAATFSARLRSIQAVMDSFEDDDTKCGDSSSFVDKKLVEVVESNGFPSKDPDLFFHKGESGYKLNRINTQNFTAYIQRLISANRLETGRVASIYISALTPDTVSFVFRSLALKKFVKMQLRYNYGGKKGVFFGPEVPLSYEIQDGPGNSYSQFPSVFTVPDDTLSKGLSAGDVSKLVAMVTSDAGEIYEIPVESRGIFSSGPIKFPSNVSIRERGNKSEHVFLSGVYTFYGDIDFGDRTTVTISPGTVINLKNGATLILRGECIIGGGVTAPVLINVEPSISDAGHVDYFGGLRIINRGNQDTCELRNTTLRGAKDTRIKYASESSVLGRRDLTGNTGCIVISDSKVRLKDVTIQGMHCEDAVHIVRSTARFDQVKILDSFADAIDSDFSTVEFENLTIKGAGNDGIDFSFSKARATTTQVSDVRDKAISVGERSNVLISTSYLGSLKGGVAIKDNSTLSIQDSLVRGSAYAVASYTKKERFRGKIEIITDNVFFQSDTQSPLGLYLSKETTLFNGPLSSRGNMQDRDVARLVAGLKE